MKPATTNDLGVEFREGAQFSCAPWKSLRIFEENVGVFQDAHFRKRCASSKGVRTFEPGRRPGPGAVDPGAPGQPLASASFALFGQNSFGSCVQLPLERPVVVGEGDPGAPGEPPSIRKRQTGASPPQAKSASSLQALRLLGRFVHMREGPARKEKAAPLD
jgi:hypothetical protein